MKRFVLSKHLLASTYSKKELIEVLAPFLSMVIHGLLGICSFFKLLVCVCLENFLLRDNPCISPQGCDEVCFEKFVLKGVCVKSFH